MNLVLEFHESPMNTNRKETNRETSTQTPLIMYQEYAARSRLARLQASMIF